MRRFYAELGHRFYQEWLGPTTEPHKKRLIVVPDGILHYIPFEALLTEAVAPEQPFEQWPYLLQQTAVSYRYAASLVEEEQPQLGTEVLAFAPDYSQSAERSTIRAEVKRLSAVEQELVDLEQRFEGDYFYGTAAQERLLKEATGQYGLIHLAMHGLVNPEEPLASSLVFAQS